MKFALFIFVLSSIWVTSSALEEDVSIKAAPASSWSSWLHASPNTDAEDMHVPAETANRFATAFPKDHSFKLSSYIDWKNAHRSYEASEISGMTDSAVWKMCMSDSFIYTDKKSNPSLRGTKTSEDEQTLLPQPKDQVIYDPNVKDVDGHPVVQLFPTRMDLSIDNAKEVYVDAIASYAEAKLALPDYDKFTVLFDIRPGRGWANPNMKDLMSAASNMVNTLADLHPGQFHKIVIFPVPKVSVSVYNFAIKPFLSKSVSDQVVLVSGADGRHAPAPKDALSVYVSEESIDLMEKRRLSLFSRR